MRKKASDGDIIIPAETVKRIKSDLEFLLSSTMVFQMTTKISSVPVSTVRAYMEAVSPVCMQIYETMGGDKSQISKATDDMMIDMKKTSIKLDKSIDDIISSSDKPKHLGELLQDALDQLRGNKIDNPIIPKKEKSSNNDPFPKLSGSVQDFLNHIKIKEDKNKGDQKDGK